MLKPVGGKLGGQGRKNIRVLLMKGRILRALGGLLAGKTLLLFSCRKQKLQQPKWCEDECDGTTSLELFNIITRLGAGGLQHQFG